MKHSAISTAILFLVLATTSLAAQTNYRVHSHNDYLQDIPFWYAYSNGAESMEVDLFLKNDTLFVTHSEEEIQSDGTFEKLYLEQLSRLAQEASLRPVQLLIDLKSEAYQTLEKVVAAIEKTPLLADEKKIKFVISGNRPKPADYPNYPDFIYFDHQSLLDLADLDLSKIALISQSFKAYSVWNGYGRMTAQDLTRVNLAIQQVQKNGKPFRFWATPDTKTAWSCFAELGLDFINTDEPALARAFLDKLERNTYEPEPKREVYLPQYRIDPAKKPKNIILMIGDGNGLAQISAAMMANRGELSIAKIKNMGLVNTASADDPVTDSAAAGTAISTGVKANNRAIGVDPSGKARRTLIEILSSRGYNTGIITTDAIDGATPSPFYAHTEERDDSDKIIEDLIRSEIDFFISGGKSKENKLRERFFTKTLEEFTDLAQPTAIYNGNDKMPSMIDGRDTFLPESLRKALKVLQAEEKPFFLLVEGAQIDNGGHANDIAAIISEGLDFDQTVGEALQFADDKENTLVIITADHETGGLGIAGGNGEGRVRADFLSVDHSGIPVPLFAYGPQATAFTGIFDNTEIFNKILVALGIKKNR
jgi:alkaline phosphatase